MSGQEIGFGTKVEDKITGYTGRVVSYSMHKSGCNMYFVQPPVDKDGKRVNGCWVEEQALKVVGGSSQRVEERPPQVFPFEAVVRDTTSGFQGKVSAFATQMYGANRYTVQPPVDKDGKYPDALWFDEQNLELVSSPSNEEVKRQEETKQKRPGGPASRVR